MPQEHQQQMNGESATTEPLNDTPPEKRGSDPYAVLTAALPGTGTRKLLSATPPTLDQSLHLLTLEAEVLCKLVGLLVTEMRETRHEIQKLTRQGAK